MPDDRPRTKEELDRYRRSLSMLSEDRVRHYYREAWEQCKMKGDELPKPSGLQRPCHGVEAPLEVEAVEVCNPP